MTKSLQTLKAASVAIMALAASTAGAQSLPLPRILKSSALQAFSLKEQAPAKAPMKAPSADYAKAEVVIDEDFSKWTKGTQEEPWDVMVEDSEADALMSYKGDWVFFRMYEAGGAGYMGFDEVGSEGPGYIKTPTLDLTQETGSYFRVTARVKNVNPNAQDAGLQYFALDEKASIMFEASTQPMVYEEWAECQWIGSAPSDMTSFMLYGWQGKVLMDHLTVEKIVYPLKTPVVLGAELQEDGNVRISWEKVEGATGYEVEVNASFDTVATTEVGDVDSCVVSFALDPKVDTYTIYVTAVCEEGKSYYGYKNVSIQAPYVGDAVALPATDVSADGFTANWETAAYASKYMVFPTVKHTATETEYFPLLEETFSAIPEENDEFAPIMIAPMMGFGGNAMNMYFSRPGWTADMAIMMNMMGMPMFAISNLYAAYGLPGVLTSPLYDFTDVTGDIYLEAYALSSVDDVALEVDLVNADGEVVGFDAFEITPEGDMVGVTIPSPQQPCNIAIRIIDSADEGDMAAFIYLSVMAELNEGETITSAINTVFTDNVNSVAVECPVDEFNQYSYAVQGYISADLFGGVSESVEVDGEVSVKGLSSLGRKAVASNGMISVLNPAGEAWSVYTLDGRQVASGSASKAQVKAESGIYVVKVGKESFKLVL